MLGAIYVGMAGMNAYSKGLDMISNNVANLNTVGFKAGLASFSEVVYRNGGGASQGSAGTGMHGGGVQVDTTRQDFGQGGKRDSKEALDVMLQGNGFFVFEKDGKRYYSRAGEFDFDKDGYFIDKSTRSRVMVSTDSNSLGSLQIDPYRVNQPRATTEVTLAGNLARSATAVVPVDGIIVYDSSGAKHTLKVRLTPATAPAPTPDPANPAPADTTPPELTWKVEVLDDKNQVLGGGTLVFDADGTPAATNTPITATVKAEGLPDFTITLNLGKSGTYAGVTSLASLSGSNTGVSFLKQDGHELGSIMAMTFDERGNLEITYSNSEKKKIGRLVLARFDASGDLSSVGDRMYVTQPGREPQLGGALDFGLGSVVGNMVETSNVDLTGQFSDLIIVQRGYQACSQMTSVANEMMQQLLAMQGGK